MAEEKKSKKGLIIGAVAVGVVALGVGGYYLLRNSGGSPESPCKVEDYKHQVTQTFTSTVGDPAMGEDLVFDIDNFCDKAPAKSGNGGQCVAKWAVDKIEVSGNRALPAGTEVTVQFLLPYNGAAAVGPVVYKLGSGTVTLTDTLFLYEGTKAWIDLDDANSPLDTLRLTLGSLCIVENIDGGDSDNGGHSDRNAEPTIAKGGLGGSPKVKRGS
ncbi:MAG: hypothetical protein U0176_23590 [Bacteroidia bacterium]